MTTVVSTVVVETTGGSVQRRARLQATLIRYSVLIRDAKLGGPMSSTWLLNRTFVGYFYAVVGPSIYTPGSRQGGVSIYPERCTQCRWRMLNGRVSKAWPYLVKSALLRYLVKHPTYILEWKGAYREIKIKEMGVF